MEVQSGCEGGAKRCERDAKGAAKGEGMDDVKKVWYPPLHFLLKPPSHSPLQPHSLPPLHSVGIPLRIALALCSHYWTSFAHFLTPSSPLLFFAILLLRSWPPSHFLGMRSKPRRSADFHFKELMLQLKNP